jgi:hypothetical protein
MEDCHFTLPQIVVYIGEELEIEPKMIGLGSTSNEERRFTIVGTMSSIPISSTYDPTHSPCNITPSCLMSSLKRVSRRSVKLSMTNNNIKASPNKPMVQSKENMVEGNVEKVYVNSPIKNPTKCSIIGKEVQAPSTTTKNGHGNLITHIHPNVFFSSFLMGLQASFLNV